MADQKISQLNEVISPNSTDVLPIVSGGETKKITVANLVVAGSSGTSGSNGSSGTSGINGTSGSNGSSGTSGINGTSGSNGSSGTSGINGTNGSSGTSGNGTSGTSGSNGTNGSSGTSGTSGSNGTNGSSGTSGTSGTSPSGVATTTVNPDYIQVEKSADQTFVAKNADINFNTITATNSGITHSNGIFTLTAGKTYLLDAFLNTNTFTSTSAYIWYSWVDATNNAQLDTSNGSSLSSGASGVAIPATWTSNDGYHTNAKLIYTPATNQTIKLRTTDGSGTCTVLSSGTRVTITQINPTVTVNNGSSGTSGTAGTSGTSGYVDNDWLYFTPSTATIPSTGNNFILSGTTTSNGSVSYNQSTGIITLAANKTYKLNASFALANNINNAETQYQWINVTTSNTLIGNLAGVIVVNSNATAAWQPLAEAIIVTTGTTQVALRSTFSNSTGGFSTSQCFMMVTQINGWSGTSGTSGSNGSSGTSGSNGSSGTSGVVSYTGLITTGSISTTQNITGSVIISGSMNIITTTLQVGTGSGDEGGEILLAKSQTNNSLTGSGITIDSYQNRLRIFEQGGGARGVYLDLSKAPAGVSGELTCKSSGIVNAGTFVTLDNIKATLTSSGNRGLSVATVSGTVTGFISAHYQGIGGSSGSNASSTSLSTSGTTSMFSWNFTGQGDTSTYILRDDTNDRVYRIILIIGGTYLNNFISIERLH